jgi:methyltransferase-like protein/ubiquinone/menaquinone biosynthesis C-methylase UbiE
MDETVEKLRADYDAMAYDAWEHVHAHPDRIAAAAALRGFAAAPVDRCRVLEVACGIGGNLLPMAEQMPGSRFVGIDLSPRQIESGAALVRELGLTNIELRCQDLMDFPEDAGEFDYIIAHGFYSWVPAVVRRKLFDVCQRHLSKNGLAFVSYNVLPGWRTKGVIRDMMVYNARGAADAAERVKRGREIVKFMGEYALGTTYYQGLIHEFEPPIVNGHDSHVLHEHLEVVNDAFYLRDFVKDAGASGLSLVGDANAKEEYWGWIPVAARERISEFSADAVERDQYVDFLMNRMFRRSVLCRSEARPGTTDALLREVRKMYIAGNPAEKSMGTNGAGQAMVQFGTEPEQMQVSDPRAIGAMRHLARAWPSAVAFSELAAVAVAHSPAGQADAEKNAAALAQVIEMARVLGVVEIWSRSTDFIARTAGEYPRATRVARWQAAHQPSITSLRHLRVKVNDLLRDIVPLLDGTRDRNALAAALAARNVGADPKSNPGLELILERLLSASLLVKE